MEGIQDNAFERKVRRFVYGSPHTARIVPGPGFGETAETELSALSGRLHTPLKFVPRLKPADGGTVIGNIDFRSLCELTLRLLAPSDVRLFLYEGKVTGKEEFEMAMGKIDFDPYLPRGSAFTVRADSGKSRLYHEGLMEELATGVLERNGRIRTDVSEFRLFPVLFENILTVELSFAGDPLWKRGYRAEFRATAPLREDLAQSAVRSSAGFHFRREGPIEFQTLIIPFSGTGTFLFESLMNRWELTSRMFGRRFAFESFPCVPTESLNWISGKTEAASAGKLTGDAETPGAVTMTLLDNDAEALKVSERNADRFFTRLGAAGTDEASAAFSDTAGFHGGISFTGRTAEAAEYFRRSVRYLKADALARSWTAFLPEKPGTVFLPLNPPYGKRLHGTGDGFRKIGMRTRELALSATGRGGELFGFVLCPDEDSWRAFLSGCGDCPVKTLHFSQGGLDIRLVLFSFAKTSLAS